jgi:hypothetical protein
MANVAGRAPEHQLRGRGHHHLKYDKIPGWRRVGNARHSSEPQVHRRVSSSKLSRCTLLDISHAQRSSISSTSRRTIFCARPSASIQAEASAVEFSAPTQDTCSSTSLSILEMMVHAVPHPVASREAVSAASKAATCVAPAVVMASHARVTLAIVMSMIP